MTYSLPSIIEPGRMLNIVVKANVTERKPHRAVVEIPFSFPFRDKPVQTQIKGYDIHEMLGTKHARDVSAEAWAGFVRFVLGAHQVANPG
jgi:hypothetical protein